MALVANLLLLTEGFFMFFIESEYYNDTDYYQDINMPNSTVQDHRQLHAWSEAGSNSTGLPLDMKFNDGHRLSIAVYRYEFTRKIEIQFKKYRF